MKTRDVQPTFIVGCPRSGTTLLQGMLAAHPQICSFPETHFFSAAFPVNPLRRAVTWPSRNGRRCMMRWLRELGRDDLLPLARASWQSGNYAAGFVAVLDRLAQERDATRWVEKTPEHFRRIPQITAALPTARFIHLVRNGYEVVQSLHKASNQDPKAWHTRWRWVGKGLTRRACIARWNEAVSVTERCLDNEHHAVVLYDDLTIRPEAVARALADFLGLRFDESMLHPERVFDRIVIRKEDWKRNNAQPIQERLPEAATPLLYAERTRIEAALRMDVYQHVARHALAGAVP